MSRWLETLGRLRGALGTAILLCVLSSVASPFLLALERSGECAEKCCRREKAKAHACCKRSSTVTALTIESERPSCCENCGVTAFSRIQLVASWKQAGPAGPIVSVAPTLESPTSDSPTSPWLSDALFQRPPPVA